MYFRVINRGASVFSFREFDANINLCLRILGRSYHCLMPLAYVIDNYIVQEQFISIMCCTLYYVLAATQTTMGNFLQSQRSHDI